MSDTGPPARLAELSDIAELVRLRAEMFASMGIELENKSWQLDAAEHYERKLSNGAVVGAVVDRPNATGIGTGIGIASGGVVSFLDQIPSPTRPFNTIGHISSMFTEPAHRNAGLATKVLDLLLEQIRRRGVTIVELHATPEGEKLYRSRGFSERIGGLEMRAVLRSNNPQTL